jgi:GNAT superfamily N-acetyltransferase
LTIQPFERSKAAAADFALIQRVRDRIRAESWPDDPPLTLEETMRNWREPPSYVDQRTWFVTWDGSRGIVAQAGVSLMRTPENRHAAWSWIGVLPEMRRQGIARELVRLIAETARADDRRLLFGTTNSKVTAGDAFMERVGATRAMAAYTNQLDLADLNRDLVRECWIEPAALEGEFEIGLWEGLFPEAIWSDCGLQSVMNTAPRDNLELGHASNVDQLRQSEAWFAKRGTERRVLYVRERNTGQLAGYTRSWDPLQAQVLQQSDTGVFPNTATAASAPG